MKIKRFVAETMRAALAGVRAEQGSEAVIISNRRVDGGVELITAIDYDATLISAALQRLRPDIEAPAAEPVAAAVAPAPAAPVVVAEPLRSPAALAAEVAAGLKLAWAQD